MSNEHEDKIKREVQTFHKKVLRLDKNFHVYMHTNTPENIKFEEDSRGKYLKLYYHELI